MGEVGTNTKIHVAQSFSWMDAIIKLLEPQSPYQPWRVADDVEPGDGILAVLDTEPASVIAAIAVVGDDGNPETAIAEQSSRSLLELGTLVRLTGAEFESDGAGVTVVNAARLIDVLGAGVPSYREHAYLDGHTTLAAARILLTCGGRCGGCDRRLDLTRADARYHLHVHTVDFALIAPDVPVAYLPPEPEPDLSEIPYTPESIPIGPPPWKPRSVPLDWPAVLCDSCHDRMRLGGFTSFIDFRFSLNPYCPSCAARWTLGTTAGFVAELPSEPWLLHTGCCPDQKWRCGACGHRWGGRFQFDEQ